MAESLPFVRVKDKLTGHEFSVRFADPEQHEVLDKDAVDNNGEPLPPKPKTTATAQAAAKKTATTAGTPNEEGTK